MIQLYDRPIGVAINQAKQVHKTVQVSECPGLCCKAAPAPVEVVNTMAAAPRQSP